MLIAGALLIVTYACQEKASKTLYGTWEPYAYYNNAYNKWDTTYRPYFLTITGSCEALSVEKNLYGDLSAEPIPFANCKCLGDRNEVSFEDTTDGGDTYQELYHFVMDKTKDTLNGTRTLQYKDTAMVEKWIYIRSK